MMQGIPPLPTHQDEITTIFVVGFPDDMLEREFQNIFTFCCGFEAAALKIPNNEIEDYGSSKKQIIGFAKFRSVEEAIQARDVLSGRKVDADKGCILKAEMAKKNLHTKRGSNLDTTKLYSSTTYRRRSSAPDSVGLDQSFYKGNDYVHSFNDVSSYSSEFYPQQSYNFDGTISSSDVFNPFASHSDSKHETTKTSKHNSDSFYNNEILISNDEFETLPPLFSTTNPSRGFSSILYNSDALLAKKNLTSSLCEDPFNSHNNIFQIHPGADQNPPCNTLYVGNIPNDSCEEELRQLFQCCPGYRRLSFRTRLNGPMCFVEFDNVHYATQALFQLYGNCLTNSTKGGIRLSYSKNPLGVRQSTPSINNIQNLSSESLDGSYSQESFPSLA